MKIYGPYTRDDGRQHVIIVYEDGSRITQSYPRYLMEQKLGRKLTYEEDVHHKDENPSNNDINNLEIISNKDHMGQYHSGREYVKFNCPMCGKEASKEARHVKHNRRQGKAGPFCSRSCAGKFNSALVVKK